MKITAVTCVKNEGPFLLEWVAHNRTLGVSDFLFYSNDCTDGTDRLLDALAPAGVVHLPNPAAGRNYQMEALKAAKSHPCVTTADWVWIADVDEFLNIRDAGTIPDLIAACGDPQAISVTFQFFANGGVAGFEDRPVISQFTRTHNPDLWCDQTAQEVKTLIRRDFPVQYFGAHRPFIQGTTPVRWTDGGGRDVPDKFKQAENKRRIRRFPAQGARRFATLNHYALRSLDSYLVKNDRGDVNRDNRAFDDTYWRERNDAAWEETSILAYLPRLEAEMARLRGIPGVADLHAAAVTAHKETAARLMRDPGYRKLRDRLARAPAHTPAEDAILEELG